MSKPQWTDEQRKGAQRVLRRIAAITVDCGFPASSTFHRGYDAGVETSLGKVAKTILAIRAEMRPPLVQCSNRKCLGYACGCTHDHPHRRRPDCHSICGMGGKTGHVCVPVRKGGGK